MNVKKTLITVFIAMALCFFSCTQSSGGGSPSSPGGTTDPEIPLEDLGAPSNIEASYNGSSIEVQWSSAQGAKHYKVYRRLGSGGWQECSSFISDVFYLDDNPPLETEIFYGVVAERDGELSERIDMTTPLVVSAAQQLVRSIQAFYLQSSQGIDLAWNRIDEAKEYQVYRSEIKEERGTLVATLSGSTYTDQSLSAGQHPLSNRCYYYRVLWVNQQNLLCGGDVQPVPGFYSQKMDFREPRDDDSENIQTESFPNEDSQNILLYRFEEYSDVDWFYHAVPSYSEHYLRIKALDLPNGSTRVDLYNSQGFLSTQTIPVSPQILEIPLQGGASGESFQIKVYSSSISSNLAYVGEYEITLSHSF